MENILSEISKFIVEKHAKKTWTAGTDWVQYSGPYFDDKEFVAAAKSLLNEWLVMGTDSITFENLFPPLLNKKYGILTNSGSSSNLIMMSAMASKRLFNFKRGTKVITPIAGFPTTLNPILQLGFKPMFVDIDITSLNLNIDQIEQHAKRGAKIITFAHVLGNPPNMDRLMEIINHYKLILLEDCCDALGSTYKNTPLGGFGIMSSCSFYPAHHITLGEGGFVACDTKIQETVARSFREWGRACYCIGKKANLLKNGSCGSRFSNWLPSLPNEIFDHKYVYDEIGYNLKPIELQSSIGLEQLKKLPDIHVKRKENHKRLYDIFKPHEEFFILPKATEHSDPSWFAFSLTIKDNTIFNRSQFTQFLETKKIQTRPYFAGNIMLQPAYDGLMDKTEVVSKYPVARKVTTDTFFLGTSPVITPPQMDYIKNVVDSYFKKI
jgi:CDP-6-deoxy-D-xylo-4-hexulose-3-dehydrase